jgi:hypothetical protein
MLSMSLEHSTFAAPLGHHWDTPRKSMGAASELRAAAHLLAQGYDVYRSVAPHAGVDLVAIRGVEQLRVEVKTLGKPEKATHLPPFGWPTNDDWDLLLIVGPDVVIQLPYGADRSEAVAAIRTHFKLAGTPEELSTRERVAALVENAPAAQLWTAAVVALELGITRPAATDALIALDAGGSVERVGRGSYRQARAL